MRNRRMRPAIPGLLALVLCAACQRGPQPDPMREAQRLFREGDYAASRARCEQVLRAEPTADRAQQARSGIALAYIAEDRPEDARPVLDDIIGASGGLTTPDGFIAYRLKFLTYMYEADYPAALELIEPAANEIAKAEPLIQREYAVMRAQAMLVNGRAAEARPAYLPRLELPADAPPEDAIPALSHRLADETEPPDLHEECVIRLLLADAHERAGDPAEARAALGELIARYPDSPVDAFVAGELARLGAPVTDAAGADRPAPPPEAATPTSPRE